MTPFEQELKRALERREPSDNFTAQLLAKIQDDEHPVRQSWRQPGGGWFATISNFRRLAAFAVLALALAGGAFYRHQVQQQRGEAAKRQLMTALHIAGAQLQEAQRRVKRIEFPEVVMQ